MYMKLECSLEKIKNAILQAEKITGKNLTLPILSSILIIATGKSVKVRSTNLSLGIEIEIPAKIEKEGVAAIKGDIAGGSFSGMIGDTVTLEHTGESLVVKTKSSRVLIKTLPHEDFPTIPIVSGEKIVLPLQKFISGVKSVCYAASVSDIKPEISSVYMYQDGNDEIVFVSTDSFRLAEKKIKVKGIPEFPGIIIPYKNIIEIIRVLGDTDSEVSITLSKNQISLSTGMTYITSRIIDGVFPDYKQIVPKESTTTVVALKQDLVSALKLSNIFSDKFNQITCVVKPGEKLFEVYAKNTDVGENTASIAASLTGQPIEINCNYRYVMDCFQSIGADSVSFDFAGANRPLMIRGISDTSFLYLVMPMNR